MTIVVVAEKPSVARDIARVLGARKQAQGFLEGSNSDIATEFTSIILAQRGFQANARTITVADNMLEEVIGLAR